MKNIMSVDLEDYFCNLPYEKWKNYESRVEKTTQIILDLFDMYKVKATFFTLGFIAESHPHLIEKIISKGHEIASHSYYHTDLRKMNNQQFEDELKKSINILEKTSGEKILGFRAPYYSINKENFWVFDIMKKYLKYDSSIFPVRTPLYGIPEAPRFIYTISEKNPLEHDSDGALIEIPPATMRLPILGNIPIAGGFHLRFLPIQLIRFGIRRLNNQKIPAVCYIHPHDLDPSKPKIEEYPWRAYWGLKHAQKKFESLLKNFEFSSIRDTVLN